MHRRHGLLSLSIPGLLLVALWGAPSAVAQGDLCISRNGEQVFQSGTAQCASTEGSTSIAIGEGSIADTEGSLVGDSYEGNANTAIAIGDGSESIAGPGDNNSSTAIGEGAFADTGFGDANTATSVGPGSAAAVYEGSNAGTVVGDQSVVVINPEEGDVGSDNSAVVVGNGTYGEIANGSGNSLTVVDENATYSIVGENGCVVVVVMGQVYGDEACLAS